MTILNKEYGVEPIDSLKLHPRNPRRGDVVGIKESIGNHGFYGAVVVQESTNFIIAGNHRYMAAIEAGLKELPVIRIDVSDAEAIRIMLDDNRRSDAGGYDEKELTKLLEAIRNETGSLTGTGYDESDLFALLAKTAKEDLEPVFKELDETIADDLKTELCEECGKLCLKQLN